MHVRSTGCQPIACRPQFNDRHELPGISPIIINRIQSLFDSGENHIFSRRGKIFFQFGILKGSFTSYMGESWTRFSFQFY